ncbi:hypothetical protein QQS21_011901 [Conoideocrella luteorostrata]|uniref:Uncharacterized protein n=1 Tax=Conoideocrella luteorostrata TaxID=1105319 RepID=A0AAJ0FSX5_9HYPO|nr:hypothetical protein QQS21_011901 [Conoideocrella luteorostrata]
MASQITKASESRNFHELFNQAVADGLRPDASDVDPSRVYRHVPAKLAERYRKCLEPWEAFRAGVLRETGNNPDPRTIQTLKHYAEFLGRIMKGRNDKKNKKPSPNSLRSAMRRFCSTWDRENAKTGLYIPEETRRSIAPYILGPLAGKLGFVTGKAARRPRTFLTRENYVHLMMLLWGEDWHDYKHEGSRVDKANLLNNHCYTSARDMQCIIGWYDGEPDIRLKFTREFCKGRDDNQPEHPFSERMAVGSEGYPPLFAQPMVHWLANILSSGALAGIKTLDDILKIRPPKNSRYRELNWEKEMLDKPVFPEWSADGPANKPQSPTGLGKQASDWAIRARLTTGLSFHAVRREILIQCNDGGYSIGQVIKFASQKSLNVLVDSYFGSISTIDGAAMYQGLQPRKDLADDFRSATMKYNPGLKFSLPSENNHILRGSPEYLGVMKEISMLDEAIVESNCPEEKAKYIAQRHSFIKKRTKLRNKCLRDFQIGQDIDYDIQKEPFQQTDKNKDHYERIEHMLPPERMRLMESMGVSTSPRTDLWKEAIQDLIACRNTKRNVYFQQCMEPLNGKCAVPSCQQIMDSLPAKKQWEHVYHCFETYYMEMYGFAHDVHSVPVPELQDMENKFGESNQIRHKNAESPFVTHTWKYQKSRASQDRTSPSDDGLSELSSPTSGDIDSAWSGDGSIAAGTPLPEQQFDVKVLEAGRNTNQKQFADEMAIDPLLFDGDPTATDSAEKCLNGLKGNKSSNDIPPKEATRTENEDKPSSDAHYPVDRLLGKWGYRGVIWYYLKWDDGSYSFEREADIAKHLRDEFEKKDFSGFKEGAKVKAVKNRKGKATMYLTSFEGCREEWLLPERALHSDLLIGYTRMKGRRKAKKTRKEL